MVELNEKTIASKTVYRGSILNVRVDEIELPDGRRSEREIVEHSGGVSVIPVTDEGQIILVKQYRKAVEEVILELPAGKLEPGEDPLTCARRELEEETGYRPGFIERLFSFHTTPGYSDEILHLYLARELEFTETSPDGDEFITVEKINKEQIMGMLNSGKLRDSKTIIGLLRFMRGDI